MPPALIVYEACTMFELCKSQLLLRQTRDKKRTSPSGWSGLSASLATRSSPRPLRRYTLVAEAWAAWERRHQLGYASLTKHRGKNLPMT